MPDRETSTVVTAYQHGLALARAGAFFEAHEAFETAWRDCAAAERDFFQGLVHVVVSAYQRGRGKPVAAERQRAKALLGGAFAVCAAPCIGTVLASILVLASGTGSIARGVVLLVAYSLGLGAAFVLAGIAFAHAMTAFRWVRDHYGVVRVLSGATLVALGLLLFFNRNWWLQIALDQVLTKIGLGSL